MPCYDPRTGYRSKTVNESGKRSIVFNVNEGYKDLPVTLPCGQCIGCRLEKSRQWAMRLVLEASLHERNAFITLTYDEQNHPKNGSLEVSHFQKFMKRLRERKDAPIRYYHCGEYGEQGGRPHYHALLFGIDFDDKKLVAVRNGKNNYESAELTEIWGKGKCETADVEFESAAYVARYITKKITGDLAEEHYSHVDKNTGEITRRKPEYATGSKRPGIAAEWFKRYQRDVYPAGHVVLRRQGKTMRLTPPKYFKKLYERADPKACAKMIAVASFEAQKEYLKRGTAEQNPDTTWERLRDREELQYLRSDQLKRKYEIES